MGEHKAAVWLVGLRHAKKGSIIAEALETIGPFGHRPNYYTSHFCGHYSLLLPITAYLGCNAIVFALIEPFDVSLGGGDSRQAAWDQTSGSWDTTKYYYPPPPGFNHGGAKWKCMGPTVIKTRGGIVVEVLLGRGLSTRRRVHGRGNLITTRPEHQFQGARTR